MHIKKTFYPPALTALILIAGLLSPLCVHAYVKHSLSGNGESAGADSESYTWVGHFPADMLSHVYANKRKHTRGSGNHKHKGWGEDWQSLNVTLQKRSRHHAGKNGYKPGARGRDGHAAEAGDDNEDNDDSPLGHLEHPLVSELHYDDSTGLTFEGWYKDPNTDKWHDVDDDDEVDTEHHSEIPEPPTLLLLALGLYGIYATKKVRLKAGAI